jgi:hypothetical protein
MADTAHYQTDLKLEEMEKRLSAIYSRAEKTVQKKMADYAKSIDEKSAELLQAYKDAETEDEKRKAKRAYIRFYRKLVKSKEFVSLSSTVADDLYRANVEASAYINLQTPSIYALNYNYINAEMAKDIDGFTPQEITDTEAEKYSGYTQQTIDRKKDTAWNKENLKKSVLAGSLLLLGAYAIMKRSANSAVEKNRNSASMHSEGMGTDAENKARLDGMYRASDIGVKVQKQWRATLDNRTRDSHRLLDSETIDLDDTFDNGLKYPREPGGALSEICNCRCRLRYVTPYTKYETRSARQGEVRGSYKKDSSFRGTKSIEIENMSYAEWMRWRARNGN